MEAAAAESERLLRVNGDGDGSAVRLPIPAAAQQEDGSPAAAAAAAAAAGRQTGFNWHVAKQFAGLMPLVFWMAATHEARRGRRQWNWLTLVVAALLLGTVLTSTW